MLPAVDSSAAVVTVWMESTTTASGPQPADFREHRLEGVLGEHDQPVREQADPVGPQLDLPGRLLPRAVEHQFRARGGQASEVLEQQRRFADPRVAAEQDDASRHEAAAEHPVELGAAGGDAGRVGGGYFVQRQRQRIGVPGSARP